MSLTPDTKDEIQPTLLKTQQGDYVLGEESFFYRFDLKNPITEGAKKAAEENINIVDEAVEGLIILTQTCDIVRDFKERPYLEIAPLVKVEEKDLIEIKTGSTPRFVFVSSLEDKRLVVDLDRVMTVEKTLVLSRSLLKGCTTDNEKRKFSEALARKRSRAAFPDEFTKLTKKFRDRVLNKYNKEKSDEGTALRNLREIRVCPNPDWSAEKIELFFWFIKEEEHNEISPDIVEGWLKKLEDYKTEKFFKIDGVLTHLKDITAFDYVGSDKLDLDHLSAAS